MAGGWIDWAYDHAAEALYIYEKIGNAGAKTHVLQLLRRLRQLSACNVDEREFPGEIEDLLGAYVYKDPRSAKANSLTG